MSLSGVVLIMWLCHGHDVGWTPASGAEKLELLGYSTCLKNRLSLVRFRPYSIWLSLFRVTIVVRITNTIRLTGVVIESTPVHRARLKLKDLDEKENW